ncbi:MAG: hypothetical protein LUD72_00510, partial [Bacteroidales bacterium]|nr:hypothetical protein [Bacteroidales bacterium]
MKGVYRFKKGSGKIIDNFLALNIRNFMRTYRKDENSRYRSYDHAHKVFFEYIDALPDDEGATGWHIETEDDIDRLAFYLYMFLASWGMV